MRQIWPYGRAVKLRRDWCSPNTPDFSRGYVSIPGQENGWALGLGAPARRSPWGPLSSVPPLLTRGGDPVLPLTTGSLEVEATWGFHGGSDGEEATGEYLTLCHWNVKLKRHIEEFAVLPRESYMEAWPPHVNRCRSVRRFCWPGLTVLPRRQEELEAEWDS